MKRILFFNDGMETGGTEKLLVSLLNHLAGKECVITLLLPMPSDKNILIEEISQSITIKYIYKENTSHLKKKLGENFMVFFPRLFAKWKGIKESDYDQIVCFKETFFARIFSKMQLPKILWIHNILYKRIYETDSLRDKFSAWLNKKQLKLVQVSYNHFDKIVCVSDAAKNAYLSVLHNGTIPNQDIRVLYNAIDLTKAIEKSKQTIETLPQGQTNFILLTRTSPEKRTDRLISAARRLKEEGYDIHIYIIGEGMDSQSMQNSIAISHLQDIITLKGRIDNPFPYILQSKWSLCVSERESFSLALLESMALKTPVITTNCGGPGDIVDGGKYGILVDNSTEGVYQGMKMVLDNPTLSVKYSADLDKAVARFDYQGWLKSVEKLLAVNS
ncbi:MAG: glycosyltransferase [Dysgonomonas mossii]|uniref:glycosyltransferase n=1 Tax=Dysgonomonas mossii TaxID=163665 RepID=UPI001D3E9B13|nr:glycosyltransferase [Dysgonomonas mossii]MBS5795382.1 glycosyltransferase [Dysgonomonas mossii]MBS7109910.1 glycosyltransferase [Dysgonomonas mossii]